VQTVRNVTLAASKVAKVVQFIDARPESAVGKILRRDLRDKEVKKQVLGNKLKGEMGKAAARHVHAQCLKPKFPAKAGFKRRI
jgi:hypothetical protein